MALAPTVEELMGIGLAAAAKMRGDLLLDDGDVAHQVLLGGAAMADAVQEYTSNRYRQTFLDGNEGQQLVERVTDRFKELVKKPANAAGATVTFSRASAAAGAGTVPAGTIVSTRTDSEGRRQEFATVSDVFYGVVEVGDKSVLAEARATGSAGNVAAGAISLVVGSVFDQTIQVTNSSASAGGADEESDDEYRARARSYHQTLEKGTRAAVKQGALGVPGVRICTVSVDELGIMTIYVADASGGSSPGLIDAVEVELEENWVAAGAVFSVVGGEVLLQNTVIGVKLARGSAADVAGLVQVAASEELNKLSAGDVAYRAATITAVMNLDRSQFLNVEMLLPVSDTDPEPHQIIRPGTITVVDL